jgi:dimethylargininase
MPIDIVRARAQHREYERTLADLGCAVRRIPAAPDMADSVFIEDVAVVLDELALITRPGAESRRRESAGVEDAVKRLRSVVRIEPPGTMDGGDVLVVGRRIFVGLSSRTNLAGVKQLRAATAPHGYCVEALTVDSCLHLKSAVTAIGDAMLLANRTWIQGDPFGSFDIVEVDQTEPYAANALRIGGTLVYPRTFPRTRERLERRGLTIHSIDVGELQKAEGAVTCCSLIFELPSRGPTEQA